MPYHNPNSRSRRNVLRIVGVLVVLAVIAGVANFLHATTSEAAGNVKPQIETMQGIRQTAQDSITFAQGLDDPDRFAAHIETVQQCMDDYDRLADAKQIKYLLSDNLQERIIGLLYRNQQRTIIDSMRVAAHNLDGQTKELLSAVDAAMADDFSQHAAQWLLQVDDPTQANELIDRYGKQRAYASMREMLADLRSLHKLRSDVKQQVSTAVSNLHNAEAAAAAIAVPERNGDLDPAGWYTLATNVASTMGVQIEQTWNSTAAASQVRIRVDSWLRITARCPTARRGMSCICSPRIRIGRRPREALGWWTWSSTSSRTARS